MKLENLGFLSREQQLSLYLKSLYRRYGYRQFRLSSFDEYSLYADNQSFFNGKDVISFSVCGKLLALRPDVTLSIIKNGRFGGETQKIFYDEKVYRKTGGGLAEVSQIGVEIIGEADAASLTELCTLMLETLSAYGRDYALDVSHIGVVEKILARMKLRGSDRDFALECLSGKNSHDFLRFAAAKRLDESAAQAFNGLINLSADAVCAKAELNKIGSDFGVGKELSEIYSLLSIGGEKIQIDFSIGGDSEYYNGLIFKGYIEGIPHAALTGGRYDKLLKKFSDAENAMGFALYLGELCRYAEEDKDCRDAVLIYNDKNAPSALKQADKIRADGVNLLLSKKVPENFNGKIIYAENKND